jgi:hypothetical protein
MKKILYIGGVGSDSYLVSSIASALAERFNANAIGMSFSEAYKDKAKVARLAPECMVITHSAGMILLRNTAPKELIAIAPPMPVLPSLLIWRSFPKTMALIASGTESYGRPGKIFTYHIHSAVEHIVRPLRNSLLKEVCTFNAAQLGVEMTQCGTNVTLVFMENDRLFPESALHPHVSLAREHGVKVFDTILGHHDEFIFYPNEVLAQLDR